MTRTRLARRRTPSSNPCQEKRKEKMENGPRSRKLTVAYYRDAPSTKTGGAPKSARCHSEGPDPVGALRISALNPPGT
jgi:hypothetical protein